MSNKSLILGGLAATAIVIVVAVALTQTLSEGEREYIAYSRTTLALSLLATGWSWVVLAGVLATRPSVRMRDLATRLLSGRPGVSAVYFLLLGILTWLLALPLDFYGGFAVEHRFGLSTESFGGWLRDQLLGLGIGLAMGVPLVAALYWAIRRWRRLWWLGVAVALILLSVVFATLLPVAISPLFNSYQPVEDRALVERIETMARSEGVRVSDVLVEDTSRRTVKANAYFTGLGPTKRIVLTDTLLQQFTPDEVVTVVAHELGHQVHNDIWRGIAVGSLFYLVGAYLVYRLLAPLLARFRHVFGVDQVGDVASLPLLALLFSLLSFAAMPALNSYSRAVEHQADAYALELTHDNRSFISAMEKLAEVNLSDPDPPKPLEVLFYTHPSIKERIEFARSLATRPVAPRRRVAGRLSESR